MNPVFEEQAEHMNISVPTDSRYSAIHLLRYTHIYEKKKTQTKLDSTRTIISRRRTKE